MRIYPEPFLQHPPSSVHSCYLIFGDEPWYADQCKQHLYIHLKSKGFTERDVYVHDSTLSWAEIQQSWNSLGLFAEHKIIEIQCDNLKLGKEGSQALQPLMAQQSPERVLVLTGGKLSAEQTKTRWFKILEEQGVYLPCTTPAGYHLERWVDQRISFHGLQLTSDAKQGLIYFFEGNLLGADQALLQLTSLPKDTLIDADILEAWLSEQSKFNVFQLADAILLGQAPRVHRVFSQLQEHIAFPIMLWAILQELERLQSLAVAQEQRKPLAPIFKQHRIWQNKQNLYQRKIQELSTQDINALLGHAHELEYGFKFEGLAHWSGLLHLSLMLCDPQLGLVWLESHVS